MHDNIAKAVIDAFGGLTKAAKAIGAPVTTVQSWQDSGRIPSWRRTEIISAAERLKINLPAEFLGKAPWRPSKPGLRALRKELFEVTLSEMARRLDIPVASLVQIEAGHRRATLELCAKLRRLAKSSGLRWSDSWLFDDEEAA